MQIHYLQHVPFEGPAYIDEWVRNQGHALSKTALFDGDPLPDPETFDVLVVMGGPMGVHDIDRYDWLTREKHFIGQCLEQNKRMLGICLGAQLIADVLGARVYPNPHKEIGWFRVNKVASAAGSPLEAVIPDDFFAFHWHGDTFDLPPGAVHLAESKGCRHQAFFVPPAVMGLQFHLESTAASIAQLIENCGDELTAAPFIQSAEDIQSRKDLIAPSNECMQAILAFMLH